MRPQLRSPQRAPARRAEHNARRPQIDADTIIWAEGMPGWAPVDALTAFDDVADQGAGKVSAGLAAALSAAPAETKAALLRKVWARVDADGSGVLDGEEVAEVLQQMAGRPPTAADLARRRRARLTLLLHNAVASPLSTCHNRSKRARKRARGGGASPRFRRAVLNGCVPRPGRRRRCASWTLTATARSTSTSSPRGTSARCCSPNNPPANVCQRIEHHQPDW